MVEAYYNYLNDLLNRCRTEFPEISPDRWVNPYNVPGLREKRNMLIKKTRHNRLFKGTKPYLNHISRGCELCGSGFWSCLFITQKCNANCFYCPARQDKDEVPATHGLVFETATEYARYVNHFGFKGVSFSGGEPLLVFDRTMEYLEAVRKNCDPSIYTWLYTNGILLDEKKAGMLAGLGLDEIRFDIGATGYSLEKIKKAKGIIPNLTIEIPAVPEEVGRIREILPEMIRSGVTNLNLHQLRLTKYNAAKLLGKNYMFIPAERPLVLESEIAALEILEYVRDSGMDLGVNYCSFQYKHQFQKAGYRAVTGKLLAAGEERLTRNGYLRKLTDNRISYEYFFLDENGEEGFIPGGPAIGGMNCKINRFVSLPETSLDGQELEAVKMIIEQEDPPVPSDELLFSIWQREHFEGGFREI